MTVHLGSIKRVATIGIVLFVGEKWRLKFENVLFTGRSYWWNENIRSSSGRLPVVGAIFRWKAPMTATMAGQIALWQTFVQKHESSYSRGLTFRSQNGNPEDTLTVISYTLSRQMTPKYFKIDVDDLPSLAAHFWTQLWLQGLGHSVKSLSLTRLKRSRFISVATSKNTSIQILFHHTGAGCVGRVSGRIYQNLPPPMPLFYGHGMIFHGPTRCT